MAKKRPSLGRTLDALRSAPSQEEPTQAVKDDQERLREISLQKLHPCKYQPRRQFDPESLEELASSIRKQGLLQRIVVRPMREPAGDYEIIAGERRWRACQLIGLKTIPALVREADDPTVMALTLIENMQRDELNVIEEARGINLLLEECALTHEQVAEALGLSRASVTNLLRLLQLAPAVQSLIESGALSPGHGKVLVAVAPDKQISLTKQTLEHQWSVRELEKKIKQQPVIKKTTKPILPEAQAMEELLRSSLTGLNVELQHQASGKGKLLIKYDNLQQLELFLALAE